MVHRNPSIFSQPMMNATYSSFPLPTLLTWLLPHGIWNFRRVVSRRFSACKQTGFTWYKFELNGNSQSYLLLISSIEREAHSSGPDHSTDLFSDIVSYNIWNNVYLVLVNPTCLDWFWVLHIIQNNSTWDQRPSTGVWQKALNCASLSVSWVSS